MVNGRVYFKKGTGGLDMIVKKDQIRVMVILSMMSYAHTRLQNGMENWHMVLEKEIGEMPETHLLSNAVSEVIF